MTTSFIPVKKTLKRPPRISAEQPIEPPSLEDLSKVRVAAIKKLHTKVIEAYERIDIKEAFTAIESRIISDMQEVTDRILGIDRRWSEIEIKEGRLRTIIQADVDKLIEEKARPLILKYIEEALESKVIQRTLQKAIKNRIQNTVYNIEHHSCDTSREIEKLVQAEINRVFTEFTQLPKDPPD